jgi:octaprenyl-diphosphate synthase
MDYLSLIRTPISKDLDDFVALFNESLSHQSGLLATVLEHIRQRG